MAVNTMDLRSRLEGDFDEAKKQVGKTAAGLGVTPRQDGELAFEPRALRIKGKVVGQAEFANAKRMMDDAVRELTLEVEMVDMNKAGKIQHEMSTKMNALKKLVVEHGVRLDKEMNRMKLKQEERAAMINALAGTAQGIGQIAIQKSSVRDRSYMEDTSFQGGMNTSYGDSSGRSEYGENYTPNRGRRLA